MGEPKGKKSYSSVCIPQTGKCFSHVHGSSSNSHHPHVPVPNQLPSSNTPGTVFPTPQYHSPSIAAVPTKQGVIGTLQEIEVPFGSQRPQRKHVTHVDTLWTHAPIALLWTHLCGPHTPNGCSLGAPPPPLRSLGRCTIGISAASSQLSALLWLWLGSRDTAGAQRGGRIIHAMRMPGATTYLRRAPD